MNKEPVSLGFGGVSVPLGSHLSALYRNRKEKLAVIVPFIKTGLEQRAKCIYVIDEETRGGLEQALRGAGVDTGAALSSGQLSILTSEETYLSQGYFTPEKMLDFYGTALHTAIQEGYGEVRITGEMTWALQKMPGVERVIEYEAKLDKAFNTYPHITICQYNIARVTGDFILDVLKAHPDCILGGVLIHNHFYQPPEVFLKELRERPG